MHTKHLYLKNKLTLTELSEELNINPKYLSFIINSEKNKNFYDYINAYRIEKAKKELLLKRNKQLTIEAICKECGFNSKSTFNDVFKKLTGQTPTQFIKENS
jgi:YesN/AraC family two-component response regulator